MKLAIVRARYNPFGGAERFVERALAALAREGTEVTLIARQWDGGQEPVAGYSLLTCDPPYRGRVARDRSFARCVQQALLNEHFDLVQSHERIPGCSIYRAGDGVHAAWLGHRARMLNPLQRLAQRLDPYHRYVLAAEREMFSHPALRAVICNSRLIRDEIMAHYALPSERLRVIRNGVDLERFHPNLRREYRKSWRQQHGIGVDVPLFLYVGNGFERKGVPRLLCAFATLGRVDARLVVVGGDRRLEAARRLAQHLGIAQQVIFAGPQKDVCPWYGAADSFVLPTLYDPFPNAALEAMACGLPIITSTACGAAEMVAEGINGYVCDALDLPALTRALAALTDSTRAAVMGAAARESVQGLSLDVMAQELLALYRELLGGGGGGLSPAG